MVLLTASSGSGSSNTTKTTSTDNSSRHSNVSTAPSSADYPGHDEWRNTNKRPTSEAPLPPIPKSSSSGSFFKAAGRTFSFGGQKKQLPPAPSSDDPLPPLPHSDDVEIMHGGRARATTTSTSTTVTAPTIDESNFNLDLGGDFSKMLGFDKRASMMAFDKRASMMTVRDDANSRQQASAPRSLTASRTNQPSPIQINKGAKVDPSPYSWGSHHSNDGLLTASPAQASPTNESSQLRVPRKPSPSSANTQRASAAADLKRNSAVYGRRASAAEEQEGEDVRLLKDSLSAGRRLAAGAGVSDRQSSWRKADEENLFDSSFAKSNRPVNRTVEHDPLPTRNKVMTPAQFERYRKDKERQDTVESKEQSVAKSDDEDNYDDDEDDLEKARQQAKQRRKQEAHMTVYRQQMMKVTGESGSSQPPARPGLQLSYSTPNLPDMASTGPGSALNQSDGSDEDEEVPLAILAAHGFPSKNRAPTRLSSMASNPNLRASQQPSYQRPGSVVGDASGARNSRLPAFARNLPRDPFIGAGLVSNPVRESFALGGGTPGPGQPGGPLPPGGLVGVIAHEERSRAMRRGSPHIDNQNPLVPPGSVGYDPVGGIPPHMMYQNRPTSALLQPGDPGQMHMNQQQMNQQMQQFMQMQMQFMQMMASQGGNAGPRPNSAFIPAPSTGGFGDVGGMPGMGGMGYPDAMRHSFVGDSPMLDLPRGDQHMRTMSMVQPSSASWIQPPLNPGYAPSIHIQGTSYAPSIAPSERSNIGLPGRYRPVSHVAPPAGTGRLAKSSTMSGALGTWSEKSQKEQPRVTVKKAGNSSDDDDEEGWQAMKAKREKKRSLWRTKKSTPDISALMG